MNKYTFRRFIASTITVPLAIAAYFLLWAVLIAAGAEGTFTSFQSNLPFISVAWVLGWTFGPDLGRYLERQEAARQN